MAVHLISKVWPIDMKIGRKFVLVALCDAANDDGACFLCVDTIAYKCGMSLRAVRAHLADLEESGFLRREERRGRSSIYHIQVGLLDACDKHPAWLKRQRPSANSAYPSANPAPRTPADSAPRTITYPLPNQENTYTARFSFRAELLQRGVPHDLVNDWLVVRQTKKAANTQTALKTIEREAAKANLPLAEVVRICCEKSWRGFEANWLEGNSNAKYQHGGRGSAVAKGFRNAEDVLREDCERAAREMGDGFYEADGKHVWQSLDGEVCRPGQRGGPC